LGRYVIKRLLDTIPVFFGATFLVFFMVFALPGDPLRALTGEKPLTPAVQRPREEEYNHNDTMPVH